MSNKPSPFEIFTPRDRETKDISVEGTPKKTDWFKVGVLWEHPNCFSGQLYAAPISGRIVVMKPSDYRAPAKESANS